MAGNRQYSHIVHGRHLCCSDGGEVAGELAAVLGNGKYGAC